MDKRPKKDAVPNVTQAMMLIASMSASKRAAKRPRDDSEDLDTKEKTDHVAPDLQPEPGSSSPSGIDSSAFWRHSLHLLLIRWCWQKQMTPPCTPCISSFHCLPLR